MDYWRVVIEKPSLLWGESRESVRSTQLSGTIYKDKYSFQTHWGSYICWGELGCNARRLCGCPWACRLSSSRYSQVPPQGHCENSGALAFPLLHSQDASYKTCLLELVFSWHSLSCVLLSISSVWWAVTCRAVSCLCTESCVLTVVPLPALEGFISSQAINIIKAPKFSSKTIDLFNCLRRLRCFFHAVPMPAAAEGCNCRVNLGLPWSPKTVWLLRPCSQRTNSSLCTLQNEVWVSCHVVSRNWTRERGWSQALKNVACA